MPASNESFDGRMIRALVCLMFFTFAMTTDAVGSVIPAVIAELFTEHDGGERVPVRDDGRHSRGCVAARFPRRSRRPQAHCHRRSLLVRRRIARVRSQRPLRRIRDAAGAFRPRHQRFQDRRARSRRRRLRVHDVAYAIHEHDRGLLRRRRHRGPGRRRDVDRAGPLLEMALRGSRRYLRAACRDRLASALSRHDEEHGRARHAARDGRASWAIPWHSASRPS